MLIVIAAADYTWSRHDLSSISGIETILRKVPRSDRFQRWWAFMYVDRIGGVPFMSSENGIRLEVCYAYFRWDGDAEDLTAERTSHEHVDVMNVWKPDSRGRAPPIQSGELERWEICGREPESPTTEESEKERIEPQPQIQLGWIER